jgi:hypothetical protein
VICWLLADADADAAICHCFRASASAASDRSRLSRDCSRDCHSSLSLCAGSDARAANPAAAPCRKLRARPRGEA